MRTLNTQSYQLREIGLWQERMSSVVQRKQNHGRRSVITGVLSPVVLDQRPNPVPSNYGSQLPSFASTILNGFCLLKVNSPEKPRYLRLVPGK